MGDDVEIVIFESGDIAPEHLQKALAAEGHRVLIRPTHDDNIQCDLVVLDAASWSDVEVGRLAKRLPDTELLFLVDNVEVKLPTGTARALVKPVDANKLVRLVRVVDQARSGQNDARDLVDFETLFCGDSPAIIELLRRVGLLAESDAPVWLHGELGSGRAVVARAIHDRSARQGRMFMALNAAAYPGDLLEEQLFGGVEPMIQRANGGSLFIDSVTELSPGVQAKLLRLLEEHVLRVRGVDRALDVRLMVSDERRSLNVGGRLRRELYYRLNVHELDLPPLREREGDLGAIVARMLGRLRGNGHGTLLSTRAIETLEAYPFPGNIRELAHALTHAAVLSQGGRIEVDHLPHEIRVRSADAPDAAALETLETVAKRFERDYLLRVLRAVGGNRTRAARVLDLSRKGLWQKLKAHGIAADEGRGDDDDDIEIG